MTNIRDVIQHIREAKDPFDSASKEDIQGRKDAEKKARKEKNEKFVYDWMKKNPSVKPPECPHCGISFLDPDSSITVFATVPMTERWYYNSEENYWDFGHDLDRDTADRDEAECDECGGTLKVGRDVEL